VMLISTYAVFLVPGVTTFGAGTPAAAEPVAAAP